MSGFATSTISVVRNSGRGPDSEVPLWVHRYYSVFIHRAWLYRQPPNVGNTGNTSYKNYGKQGRYEETWGERKMRKVQKVQGVRETRRGEKEGRKKTADDSGRSIFHLILDETGIFRGFTTKDIVPVWSWWSLQDPASLIDSGKVHSKKEHS